MPPTWSPTPSPITPCGASKARAAFDALATRDHGIASTKIVITAFSTPALRDLRFYDANFFTLHDEWYWFRLLNGARVPGNPGVAPVRGLSFASIRDIYAWARAQPTLPLDLQIADGRLYSWRFYDLAFGRGRNRGLRRPSCTSTRALGAHRPPSAGAFKLEYGGEPAHDELVVFFGKHHRARGPRPRARPALRGSLGRPRGPRAAHGARAPPLLGPHPALPRPRRTRHPRGVQRRHRRGSLRFVRQGDRFDDTARRHFGLRTDAQPPAPAAGVITAVPQTPLAHINLLARNRGIPNVHIAGVLDDPEVDQLARGWARVVLFAESPSRVVLSAITNEQYTRYRELATRPTRAVVTPPTASMPYVVDIATRPLAERASLIPMLGGKSTGMMALVHDAAMACERPDRPLGVTVRPYVEHLAPLRARIEAACAPRASTPTPACATSRSKGWPRSGRATPAPPRACGATRSCAENPAGTPIGDLARSGRHAGGSSRAPPWRRARSPRS